MDIYAEILEALKRKGLTRITRVSYAVGLPVDRTKNYLKDLSSSGLVGIQTGEDSVYSITHRGLEFVAAYCKLKGFLDFIAAEAGEPGRAQPTYLLPSLSNSRPSSHFGRIPYR